MKTFRRAAAIGLALVGLLPCLEASLLFSPGSPKVNDSVLFVLNPSPPNLISANGITWNFGDGASTTTATTQLTTVHAYGAAGTYTASALYYYRSVSGAPVPVTDTTTVTVTAVLPKSITFSPFQPNVLETVTFQAINFTQASVRWDFGDGAGVTSGSTVQTHAYQNPGTYAVRAYDGAADSSPAATSVTVVNKRTLSASPAQANTCENVTFQAGNFISAIRWDFGDGVVIPSGPFVQTHAYLQPGTYLVRASDGGVDKPSATTTVIVVNKRSLAASPLPAKTGIPLMFQASGFNSSCVKWSFGDGTGSQTGTAIASHTFKAAGTFLVTATDDCGNTACTATLSVAVTASVGPLAPFAVTYGRLRFENGTTNIQVGQGASGVAAYADLKYEGTGLLQVEWRVDGTSVKTDALSLTFADKMTINSGKLPGLPTAVLGPHTVTLVILRPATDFSIPSISYFVSASAQTVTPVAKPIMIPPTENTVAPIVQKIIPDTLERGQEYNLRLEGLRFTDSTAISLPGIGVKTFNRISFALAYLEVFVPMTAKEGERLAQATNEQGTNIGPGKVSIAPPKSKPPAQMSDINPCVDLAKIDPDWISLTGPAWMTWEKYKLVLTNQGQTETLVPSGKPPVVDVPVIDDFTVLQWKLGGPSFDYLEVRFSNAKSNAPIMTKTLPGSALSLHMTGDVIFELFSHIPENPLPLANANLVNTSNNKFYAATFKNYMAGQGDPEAMAAAQAAQCWADGLKKADIIWQVVGFRTFPCAYDSIKNTPKQSDVSVKVAESELSLFRLPDRPKGLACGSSGMQKNLVKVSLFNQTKDKRKKGSVLANADLIGDVWVVQGSFSLQNSPYGEYKEYSTSVNVPNLFLDWGDGTGAVPLSGNIKGAGTTWDKSTEVEIGDGQFAHSYQYVGNYTVHIFQLSDDDIQQPIDAFGETLSQAVTPDPPSGTDPYYKVAPYSPASSGPSLKPGTNSGPANNPLSGVLDRAYLVYCNNLAIDTYQDTCALGPLNLVSLEILDFPGHSIAKSGGSGQDGFLTLRKDLLALGIDAIAVTCDTALHARAKLTYFGTGDAEILWYVDNQLLYTDTTGLQGLSSQKRQNLGQGQSSDCASAPHSTIIIASGKFPVSVLGKHTVLAEVRILHSFGLVNMGSIMGSAVKSISSPAPPARFLAEEKGPSAAGAENGPPAGSLNPWLGALAEQQKSGGAAPQIGFLNPNQEPASGQPPVAYLNDLLADPNISVGNLTDGIYSQPKTYLVNEVRDQLGCKVVFPTSGGDFAMTDMGSGVALSNIHLDADNTYSGSGILHVFVLTGGSAHEEKFIAGAAFKRWSIDEKTARVSDGVLDVTPGTANASSLSFPGAWGILTRIWGKVASGALSPMTATFDITLKSPQLHQLKGQASVPVSFSGVAAPISAQGDWLAPGLKLERTQIGLTNFAIQSSNVTLDFSSAQSPSSSTIPGPAWTGIHLGAAEVIPYIPLNLTPGNAFKMNNLQDWIVGAGGLSGRAKSGIFDANLGDGHFHFQDVEFSVTNDSPDGIYHGLAVQVPWIAAVLQGDAKLVKIDDQIGYGTEMLYLTSPPVTQTYQDVGKISMTAQDFLLTTDSTGPVVKCNIASFSLEAEGKPFANFPVNGFLFGFDGRAHFDGPTNHLDIPLNGTTTFGQSTAQLKSVGLDTSVPGQERLHFTVETVLSLSDSELIPASTVEINFVIQRKGADYAGQGPWNTPYQMNVAYPLGSQDVQTTVHPSYTPQASPGPAPDGTAAGPWAADHPGTGDFSANGNRFSGSVDFNFMGAGLTADFVLGYQNGKSFFLIFANVQGFTIPLSPIPLAIFGFQGGFGYQFPTTSFQLEKISDAQPDMKGELAFAAGLTIGTSVDDGFILKGDALLTIGTDGIGRLDFKNVKIFDMGNFGGYMQYGNQIFEGGVFGNMDLLGGLIVFDLGTKDDPAFQVKFGGGGWHLYAGNKWGQRIKATIWNVGGADSYMMLSSDPAIGLAVGGNIHLKLTQGASFANTYVEGWMDMGLQITRKPFRVAGDFAAGVGAGACVDFALFSGCISADLTATIHAETPNPTIVSACVSLSVPLCDDIGFCVSL